MQSKWMKMNTRQSMDPINMTSWDDFFHSLFYFLKSKLLCTLLLLVMFGLNRNTTEKFYKTVRSLMQLYQMCALSFALILLRQTGNPHSAERNRKSQVQEHFETCKSG
jgi:hypothetical protein